MVPIPLRLGQEFHFVVEAEQEEDLPCSPAVDAQSAHHLSCLLVVEIVIAAYRLLASPLPANHVEAQVDPLAAGPVHIHGCQDLEMLPDERLTASARGSQYLYQGL
jgi:hypothetical protein